MTARTPLALEALKQQVAVWRAAGEQIVFANGAFDLLHVGHLRYLQGAKDLGGKLIVLVNSDASVRKLKGEGRPAIPQDERAELVAALACVDAVALFDDTNAGALLLELKPDVHAKGTDYTVDTVPEHDIVKGYGGRVAIVGDPKEHSTTELIRKQRQG